MKCITIIKRNKYPFIFIARILKQLHLHLVYLSKKVDLEKNGLFPNHLVEEEKQAKENHSHHEEEEKEEAGEETVQVFFFSFFATIEVIFVKQLG